MKNENQYFDFIVIGSGIAGLCFALKSSKKGTVAIFTKNKLENSNTRMAQGGIASVISKNDSAEKHIEDTLIAGDGLCNKNAVKFMVKNATKMISELEKLGVAFTKNNDDTLNLSLEGGHSECRVVHAHDSTGKEIISTLIKKIKQEKNIYIFENYFAIDLLSENKICNGAVLYDEENKEQKLFYSSAVILATGGAAQIYLHNTNPEIATGDGFAMAYRAGAKLENMEFVQFHPTALHIKNKKIFLISEALRGYGATLKTAAGKEFMIRYHTLGSLAPRDIVSRAIQTELEKTNDECVYLDTTIFDKNDLKKDFPAIYNHCLKSGIDISEKMIPVLPAAHYMCGGVKTNLHGETNIKNLFAIGEVACTGVHGANRLASNSLLEGLVFADAAAKHIVINSTVIKEKMPRFIGGEIKINSAKKNILITRYKKKLQQIIWKNAGIVRNNKGMKNALNEIEKIEQKINDIKIHSMQKAELQNMLTVSKLILESSLKRKINKGTFFNEDLV